LNLVLVSVQPSTGQNKWLALGLPFVILLLYQNFPAIIILYWIGFSLVNVLQEFLINRRRKLEPIPVGDLK